MNKKKRITLANVIIVFCVIVNSIIAAVTLFEYHRLNEVVSAGVLTALIAPTTGELLIVALRQIFGQDVIKQAKQIQDEENYP